MRALAGWVLTIGGIVVASSCGGDGSPSGPASVASVLVSPSELGTLAGQVHQFHAVTRDAAGNELTGRAVAWNTDNPSVATVSSAGVVTALSAGSARITATSEGQIGNAGVSVVASVTFASIAVGGAHTCALTASGAVYCWGRGESGQLGAPAPALCSDLGPCSLTPIAVSRGGLSFTQLVAGGAHTCGLTANGSAHCWGSNAVGQLGDGSTTARTRPEAVATGLRFSALDAGANHTCGLTSSGAAHCWGSNTRGQLGNGGTVNSTAPSAVSGALNFQVVTAGGFSIGHTCGLTNTGTAYCWGDNERGQLGIGTSDVAANSSPAQVSGGLAFAALTAGLGRHTCGFTITGGSYCWGENTFGALGDGSTIDKFVPTAVSGGFTFSQLRPGGFIGHTCGITTNAIGYCWGENERGQVGDGSTIDRLTPSAVTGGLAFASLDAGFRHTCALTTTGIVYCWGSNGAGQLGTGSTSQADAPLRVVGQP